MLMYSVFGQRTATVRDDGEGIFPLLGAMTAQGCFFYFIFIQRVS